MWAEVRKLSGQKQTVPVVDGLTADSFNQHYIHISTDTNYAVLQADSKPATCQLEYVQNTGYIASHSLWLGQSAKMVSQARSTSLL